MMTEKCVRWVLLAMLLLLTCGCIQQAPDQSVEPSQVLHLMALQTTQEFLQEAVDEFNEENQYHVTIALETVSMDNYKRLLPISAATGDLPDLFFTWEAGYLEPLVRSGNVLPLTDYLDTWQARFEPEVFIPLSFDGEIYAVPLQQSLTVMFYNKTVFQEAGLTLPDTWGGFEQLCKSLKDQGIVPLALGSNDWQAGQLLTAILAGVGGRPLYESLDEGNAWMQAQMEQSVQILGHLYDCGYVVYEQDGISLSEGTAAMQLMGDWVQPFYWEDDQIGAFLLPAVQAEYAGTCIRSVDQCYAVSASCQNPEAACAFLELLTNQKYQHRLWELTGQACSTTGIPGQQEYALQEEIFGLYQEVEDSVIWIDRGIGGDVGTRFNQMAAAILSGRDPGEELEGFQTFLTAYYQKS